MATYNGTSARNVWSGTSSADTTHGNGGDDSLNGLAGNDMLKGGSFLFAAEFYKDVAVNQREDDTPVYVWDLVLPLRSIASRSHTYGSVTRAIDRGDMMMLAHDTL